MNMELAITFLGINRTRHELQNMVRALELHQWNNTQEELNRLAAAKYVLRRWKAYQDECNKRRGAVVATIYRQRYLQ